MTSMRVRAVTLILALVALVVPVVAFAPAAEALACPAGQVFNVVSGTCIPLFSARSTVGESVSDADRTTFPAGVIVSLLGEVLPASRATETMTYQLDQAAANGSSVAGGIQQTTAVLNWIPGFKLGFKLGGYLDSALGVGSSDTSQAPVVNYVPYSGESVGGSNWQYAADSSFTNNFGSFTVGLRGSPVFDATSKNLPSYGGGTFGPLAIRYNSPALIGTVVGSGRGGPFGIQPGLKIVCVTPGSGSVADQPGGTGSGGPAGYVVVGGDGSVQYDADNGPFSGSGRCSGGSTDNGTYGSGGVAEFDLTDPSSGRVFARYLLPGNPGVQGPSPDRQLGSEITCENLSTTVKKVSTAYSASFKETDAQWPLYPQLPDCDSGTVMVGWRTGVVDPSTLSIIKVTQSWTAPTQYSQALESQPLCGNRQCYTTLWKSDGNGGYLNCFEHNDLCNGWADDPNRSTDFKCTYGTGDVGADTDVGLSGCYMYGPTFDPAQRAKGVAVSDPATDPKGGGSAKNAPAPVVQPKPMPDPSTGSTTSPGSAGQGLPGQDGASCWPSGWAAFNPLEWVLKPVKCALVWAFVPSQQSLQDFVTNVKIGYDGSVIGVWANSLSGIGRLTGIASDGCGGMTLHVPDLGVLHTAADYSVFNTCGEPWHSIALVVRAFLSLFIAWLTTLAVFRIISASFGLTIATRANA